MKRELRALLDELVGEEYRRWKSLADGQLAAHMERGYIEQEVGIKVLAAMDEAEE